MDPKDLYPDYGRRDEYPSPQNSEYGANGTWVSRQGPKGAITSMVLGICSVSLWFYPFITSIPCMILGFVAIRLAKREEEHNSRFTGFIKAGKITGTIGLVISALYSIIMAAAIGNGL
ncbi:MAG: DUF4190 domain-containing protein [Clostridia bacterium]|nr:DUF4190 domain-containing protein [Clostridia bacterium]